MTVACGYGSHPQKQDLTIPIVANELTCLVKTPGYEFTMPQTQLEWECRMRTFENAHAVALLLRDVTSVSSCNLLFKGDARHPSSPLKEQAV